MQGEEWLLLGDTTRSKPDISGLLSTLSKEEHAFLKEYDNTLAAFTRLVARDGWEATCQFTKRAFSPIFVNNLINVYEKYYRRVH
jgi:hypothetical protein